MRFSWGHNKSPSTGPGHRPWLYWTSSCFPVASCCILHPTDYFVLSYSSQSIHHSSCCIFLVFGETNPVGSVKFPFLWATSTSLLAVSCFFLPMSYPLIIHSLWVRGNFFPYFLDHYLNISIDIFPNSLAKSQFHWWLIEAAEACWSHYFLTAQSGPVKSPSSSCWLYIINSYDMS